MAEDNQVTPQNQTTEPAFTKRAVETPILDSSLRQKISGAGATPSYSESSAGGLKGFYQANKYYFWAILLGIVIISVLSWLAFRKSPVSAPKEANVTISVDVPQTVASGGEAVYKITIANNDRQKLVGMQLELAYPDGETYESSSPNADNLSGSLFTVPDLVPGQNAAVFIKARVNGNVNDQKTLDVKLHYHYNNFNSEFVKDQTSTVQLVASNVVIQLQGAAQTNNAQLVTYTISYQNNSGGDIKNARVKMDYPDGFSFAAATPPPDLGSNTWNVGTLANNASSTIAIQGTFNSANPGESKTATVEFLILGPDGNYFTQNSANFVTAISSLPLLVTQELSPANSTGIINPGDSLTFNIKYQNNAAVAATGVNIEVDLNSKVIDPSSLAAEGGQINNNTIIWNASGVPQLASLSPNQSGQLSFRIKINNPATKDSSKNLNVISSISIKSNEYSTPFPGGQLNLKVSSPTSINTALSYISGQLPPQVGKATIYKVTLSLTNSSNDFSSGVLTAFIPLGSGGFAQSSVNSAEAGNIQYDGSTGKLTWNFSGLAANTGRFTAARTLSFNITLNPSSSEAGQAVTLIKTITFTATDVYTQASVGASARDITTSDVQGQNGYGSGTVQP
jgi:hypothetical protein